MAEPWTQRRRGNGRDPEPPSPPTPDRSLDQAVEIAEAHGFDAHGWIAGRTGSEGDLFPLARRYNRAQAGRQALKNMDSYLGQIVYTVSRVNASDRYTPEERERTIMRLAEELQAEVDKFKYDTAADMEFVNAVRQKVGRELVWLDVHKDPDIFVSDTRLSPSRDAVSHLWNHVTRQFRRLGASTSAAPSLQRFAPRRVHPDPVRRGTTPGQALQPDHRACLPEPGRKSPGQCHPGNGKLE